MPRSGDGKTRDARLCEGRVVRDSPTRGTSAQRSWSVRSPDITPALADGSSRDRDVFGRHVLEPPCGGEEFGAGDVRVAADRGQVGVAEVLRDQSGVSELLPQPRRGRVAKRVRGDVLFESGSFRGAANDLSEDRLLQTSAGEAAEDGSLGTRGARSSEGAKLTREPPLPRRDG